MGRSYRRPQHPGSPSQASTARRALPPPSPQPLSPATPSPSAPLPASFSPASPALSPAPPPLPAPPPALPHRAPRSPSPPSCRHPRRSAGARRCRRGSAARGGRSGQSGGRAARCRRGRRAVTIGYRSYTSSSGGRDSVPGRDRYPACCISILIGGWRDTRGAGYSGRAPRECILCEGVVQVRWRQRADAPPELHLPAVPVGLVPCDKQRAARRQGHNWAVRIGERAAAACGGEAPAPCLALGSGARAHQ